MVDPDNTQTIEEKGIDPPSLRLLIDHGRRKGYITQGDIINCIPDTEYDENLYEEILEALTQAGVPYIEGEEEEEKPADQLQEEEEPLEEAPLEEAHAVSEAGTDQPDITDLEDVDTDDMLRLYLKEAARVPLLTAKEEVELAQRIEIGRMAQEEMRRGKPSAERMNELRRMVEEGRLARERLIRANARLVISVAKKYIGRGMPFLDLIQEGNIGLMRAIRNYEYQRGFKFSTYATWWIRQGVTRALAEQSRTIRLPVHMSDKVNRLRREQARLQQRNGRPPTREELAEALEVSPDKVDQMMEIMKRPLSLQAPVGEDEEDVLGDLIEDAGTPNPEESTVQMMMNEDLRKKLEILPPRELQVLELRYGLSGEEPMTLHEVGQRMGITRERARQLEVQALERLRNPEKLKRRRKRAEESQPAADDGG